MAITKRDMGATGYETLLANGTIHNIGPVEFYCKESDRAILDNSEECQAEWGYIANSSVCVCFDTNTTYTWDEDVQDWV